MRDKRLFHYFNALYPDIMNNSLFYVAFLLAFSFVNGCMNPPLAPGYTNAAYIGTWHEIGKIQTPGGAEYQKDCVCTKSTISSDYPVVGDASVAYDCTLNTPDSGNVTHLEASLTAGQIPGNFAQRFDFQVRPADYNVIWLDEDTAMEYDCMIKLSGTEEYCVHFISRSFTIAPEKLQVMIDFAEGLGLNPLGIEYQPILQEGCQ